MSHAKQLCRGKTHMAGGVCAGFAAHYGINKNRLRLLFLLTAFLGFPILIYLLLWFVIPARNEYL
ncbi:MAG: PspC domain-containing protein [Alteromonadaceae bacterium]|nr:PspC domain-containing protein [Alteromonadaceae bacterium]